MTLPNLHERTNGRLGVSQNCVLATVVTAALGHHVGAFALAGLDLLPLDAGALPLRQPLLEADVNERVSVVVNYLVRVLTSLKAGCELGNEVGLPYMLEATSDDEACGVEATKGLTPLKTSGLLDLLNLRPDSLESVPNPAVALEDT